MKFSHVLIAPMPLLEVQWKAISPSLWKLFIQSLNKNQKNTKKQSKNNSIHPSNNNIHPIFTFIQ